MKNQRMNQMLNLLLLFSLSTSSTPTWAVDLIPNLRPSFQSLDASPSPSPADLPSDEDEDENDTDYALTPAEQQQVALCFRDEKTCESHLAICNASFDQKEESLKDRILLFLGGIIAGFVIHNNIK